MGYELLVKITKEIQFQENCTILGSMHTAVRDYTTEIIDTIEHLSDGVFSMDDIKINSTVLGGNGEHHWVDVCVNYRNGTVESARELYNKVSQHKFKTHSVAVDTWTINDSFDIFTIEFIVNIND